MPSLTVRAAAELLFLPAYQQVRVLTDQKYPRQEPQAFRAPFYQPALVAIREYYRAGNDAAVLGRARNGIRDLRLPQRRDSNLRVLQAFEVGDESDRALLPLGNRRMAASIGTVEIRLGLDLVAEEAGSTRRIYYNCRVAALDVAIARSTLEIAHWVLEENGSQAPIRTIEFVDFRTGRVHRTGNRRQATINRLRLNARVIEALWPTL
jgi:hypothetical protein